jgi:branched-chain amino acid transport system substrate-binding protein
MTMTLTRRLHVSVGAVLALALGAACSSGSEEAATEPAATEAPAAAPVTEAAAPDTTAAPVDTEAPPDTEAPDTSAPADTAAVEECGEPATGEPIVFGHIAPLSGPIQLPSSGNAIEVYFDQYNECGGLNGRPLELAVRDGGLDPAKSGAATRELVEQEGVIGFVGNNAFLDCFGAQYYEEQQIANIGSGFDGSCFNSEVIFPTTPNYDRNLFPGVTFALDKGAKKFAYVALDIPGQRAQAELLKAYLAEQGAELSSEVFVAFGSTDATTAMQTVKEASVDAIVMSVDEVLFSSAAVAAVQQGIGPLDLTWIAPSGLYSPKALALLGDAGEGLYVVANYDVAENGNEVVAMLAEEITANYPDSQIDGFAQFGWIAAEALVAALESIEGDVTIESLLAATQALGPVTSELLPDPFTINGPLPRSVVSQALILQIEGGAYVVASDGFINFPA